MSITATKSVPLPEGIYPATLSTWEEAEEGIWGPGIKFVWTLEGKTDAEGKPIEKWQFCSQKLTPRSNLWAFCKSLGVTPTLGDTYELDELLDPFIGRRAQLVIKHEDGGDGPVARVKEVMAVADGVAPSATAGVCCMPKCKADAVIYDEDGDGYCDAHKPS